MQDKLIVAARSDGLGERFLGILNALYLCNLTGCKFGYIWNDGFSYISEEEIKRGSRRNEGMDIPSEIEIFNDNFINKYSLKDKLLDCNGNNFSGSAGPFLKSGKYNLNFFNLKSEYSWGWSSSSFDLSKIFEDIDVKHYHRHLQLLWNWLNDHFSANLKEFISSIYTIIKTRLSNNYIGFHIRSGGIIYEHRISALYGIRKALPIHITLELIKQYSSSGNKVLLFGDDVETLKQIRLFLENDNIYLIDDLVQVDLLSNFEISLSEIVLMANSSRIFSSGKSAFSIFASKIGNIDNISLYTHIAKLNQVDLIKKYINLINIHNLQKSYSLSYLFDLYEELNLNTNESEQYVKAAIDYDPDNIYYKIKYVYILLKNQKYDKADTYVYNILLYNSALFFDVLLYKSVPELGSKFINYKYFDIFFKIPEKFLTRNFIYINLNIFKRLYDGRNLNNEIFVHYHKNIYNIFCEKLIDYDNYKIESYNGAKLSYQVGFVMLSQSIKLNVFSRIFYLLLIGIKHKYDRNILNNNILDEDENKIYINFGKKFIKATKNWYKCGYIKLWFETRKLKREIRNKEGE